MARTILLFIIGMSILDSKMFWGHGDPHNIKRRETALSFDTSSNIFTVDVYSASHIIARLDHLKVLDLNTIWAYSTYFRKDIDHKALAAFEQVINSAHEHGMKVFFQVQPFKTNYFHHWFEKWSDNVSPHNNFYVTLPGKHDVISSDGTEDADAPAEYGKKWDEKRGTFYLHYGNAPCLDLSNRDVRQSLNEEIFEFWLNKGVDGFIINTLDPFVLNTGWLPLNSKNISVPNKEYLHEIRKYLDDWTTKHNSTPKFLAGITSDSVAASSFDGAMSDTPSVPLFNILYNIQDFAGDFSDATKLKTYITQKLNAVSAAEVTNRLIWSLVNRTTEEHAAVLIAFKLLALLMPGQVYVDHYDEDFKEESDLWTAYVVRQAVLLRKRPVFRRGVWHIETLNDNAVFVLRRELPDDPVIYLVMFNAGEKPETVKPSSVFLDLDEKLSILVSSNMNDAVGTLEFIPGDTVTLSSKDAVVVKALRKKSESSPSAEGDKTSGNEKAKVVGHQPKKKVQPRKWNIFRRSWEHIAQLYSRSSTYISKVACCLRS